ncbi:hypothetical protein Ssi03_13400 [Sphaerisporangium siamense]|uniref:Uncharacterized protein n=1 Tax=Sphaerisporangium siamense TaxID=795645 RepID=A0A7W7DC15_9ACTN|nr:hypothetical protein [Sphaerisporangium siamense]MBB4702891.1 hypothetical protein [Sphaerisporangium siamense]GII83350.1 hypothetical protein Ssi03_13400 [Sphaerisporangium siamense]
MKLDGEWELDPQELAALFKAKGWCYSTSEGLIIPNARGVENQLATLIKEALDRRCDEVQGGRFLVWKDPDLPHAYDLFLNIGFIWDENALDEDQEAAA